MNQPGFRLAPESIWYRCRILCAWTTVALFSVPPPSIRAQDEGIVEALAGVLATEDARRFDRALLRSAARHPDKIVRRHAALAMGRIGNPAAVPILLELLSDPDTTIQKDAAFALGLIGSVSAVERLRELILNTPADEQHGMHAEAVTAISRIGGIEGGELFRNLLARWVGEATTANSPISVVRAVGDAWRLGEDAPLDLLAAFTVAPVREIRWRTIYSLASLQDPRSAELLLTATNDPEDLIRSLAVRSLTADFADAAGLNREAVASRVRDLVNDNDPQVRINALKALSTYDSPELAFVAIDRLNDVYPNVRIQALATLGSLGGEEAVNALRDELKGRLFATRREALLGLAEAAGASALSEVRSWLESPDWRYRATAADALGSIGNETAAAWLEDLVSDPHGSVVAAAFSTLRSLSSTPQIELAVELLTHQDPAVRSRAADHIADWPDADAIGALVDSYRISLGDHISDARISIVGALGSIAGLGSAERFAVESRFLARFPQCDDYLVRRAAADLFPVAAERWGAPDPIATGKEIGDYRDVARRYLIPAERSQTLPTIVIESESGNITITLFAADAPITISALFDLIDLRYFDRSRWHRVQPDFAVQGGDPRGDGWGGPGFVLRDEVSRHRYERGTVGLALTGPDTGGSQFFITLSPQPQLDGIYPVVGRVDSEEIIRDPNTPLDRITQGERIRRIRRR